MGAFFREFTWQDFPGMRFQKIVFGGSMANEWYWYEKRSGYPLKTVNADGSPGTTIEKNELIGGMEVIAASYVGFCVATIHMDPPDNPYAMTSGGLMFVLEYDEEEGVWGTRISVNAKAVQIGAK